MVRTHSWSTSASGTVTHTLSATPLTICSARHNNLALLQQYGNNAWRVHNYLLEADTKKAENLLEELKEQTTSLNRERKNTQVNVLWDLETHGTLTVLQTRLGDQLTSLESRWTELISSILQIELANVALEAEVARLNKRETELSGAL
jgi:predicted ATP-grasp superfamily ATP-dependent carboligase